MGCWARWGDWRGMGCDLGEMGGTAIPRTWYAYLACQTEVFGYGDALSSYNDRGLLQSKVWGRRDVCQRRDGITRRLPAEHPYHGRDRL